MTLAMKCSMRGISGCLKSDGEYSSSDFETDPGKSTPLLDFHSLFHRKHQPASVIFWNLTSIADTRLLIAAGQASRNESNGICKERKQRNMQAGKGFGFSLVNANSAYTNTISARYFKDGSEILIEKPGGNPRILIPREAARLQGFPDTFYIPVSDAQAYKGFGNSVPVPVVKAIALEIDRYLNQKSTQRISRRKEIGIPESNEPERSPIHQRL
jgi:hypothetical protein